MVFTEDTIEGNWRTRMNKQPLSAFSADQQFPLSSSFSNNNYGYHKYNMKTGRPFRQNNRDTPSSSVNDLTGNVLRFCPGNNCKVLLPLRQFANNCNMSDGLDTYCIECNKRKRKERDEKRFSSRRGVFSIDKFEQYRFRNQMMTDLQVSRLKQREEEKQLVMERINSAILEATKRYKRELNIASATIYDKLFSGRRLICDVSGEYMTPSCFLKHHGVKLIVRGNRLEVKCNRCSP